MSFVNGLSFGLSNTVPVERASPTVDALGASVPPLPILCVETAFDIAPFFSLSSVDLETGASASLKSVLSCLIGADSLTFFFLPPISSLPKRPAITSPRVTLSYGG